VSASPCTLSASASVHGGPNTLAGPRRHGPGPRIIRWKLIHYSEILQRGPWTSMKSTRGPDFADFALRPLGFSKINPRSTIFPVQSEIQKIFTKRFLASEKSTKIAPKFEKFISFQPRLQI
jgi:hypothetical protein